MGGEPIPPQRISFPSSSTRAHAPRGAARRGSPVRRRVLLLRCIKTAGEQRYRRRVPAGVRSLPQDEEDNCRRAASLRSEKSRTVVANLNARIRAWWWMAGVFALAIAAGRVGTVVLF